MREDEEVELDKVRKSKDPREYFKFWKSKSRRKKIEEVELITEEGPTKNIESIKQHIKQFWEKIGGIGEEHFRWKIEMEEREILEEQNYEISKEDVKNYLKTLKNMKAVGMDGIPNEFYKEGGEKISNIIHHLCGQIIEDEEVIVKWNTVKVTLLHKGGKKSKKEIQNYRPVAVVNTIANTFGGIIKKKLERIVENEKIISDEQNGFRRDRRGTDNLYLMREIIDKAKRDGKEVYCAFLDLEKAYDTVNRDIMWEIMRRKGFND